MRHHSSLCGGILQWFSAAGVVVVFTAAGAAMEPENGNPQALCADCHVTQAQQFASSVHAGANVHCQSCHGGASRYPVPPAEMARLRSAAEQLASHPADNPLFDHGSQFLGKPARVDIPERCGSCHSDVAAMNPYGLPTDQLAQYRLSGHGKALYKDRNQRVAVCTDCHGIHEILRPSEPASSVYPTNIPATCGRCHADAKVMAGSNRSTRVVEEYRESVHGHALLTQGDTGMPTCATCHGSHSAVPPGFNDVGHVCGRCHQQEERRFLESIHSKFEGFPRCVVCHTRRVDLRDHRITWIAASPEAMQKAYASVAATRPAVDLGDPGVLAAYSSKREPAVEPFGTFCLRCHNPARQHGHRAFFHDLDDEAVRRGNRIYSLLMQAELQYAATAQRVDQLQHSVLLVKDEALQLEELRTLTVGLAILQHTLDLDKIDEATTAQAGLAKEINASLDEKWRGLRWRYWTLLPMWGFVAIFVAALWTKYKQLKAAMVVGCTESRGVANADAKQASVPPRVD